MVNKPNGEYFIPTQKLGALPIGQGIIKVENKQCTCLAINLTDETVESHGYLRVEDWDQLDMSQENTINN